MCTLCKWFCVSLVLSIVFSANSVCAQNETKKWFFGNGAGLDFVPSTPTVINGGALTTSLGCASMANSNGSLLFYTDGATIYNQTHTVMANGSGLFGGGVAQSAMILKKPASTNLYYVFTQQNSGLYYSVVDMSLASGNGSVVTKNVAVFTGNCSGKLTAARHCNGNDYWVLAICNGSFNSVSVNATGVSTTVVSSPIAATNTINLSVSQVPTDYTVGCMKLSPNGRKLLLLSSISPTIISSNVRARAVLYDFDNTTGQVSSGSFIYDFSTSAITNYNNKLFPYGCEFSPDGSKAYFNHIQLMQYDLCNPVYTLGLVPLTPVETSTILVYRLKRSIQLASNGKIYLATTGNQTVNSFVPTNSLSVINNPNATGALSAYTHLSQSLGTYSCQWGLPNFPGFYFEQRPTPNFSYAANGDAGCLTNTFFPAQVCSSTGYSITGYQWDFGEPASGPLNTSFLMNPTHSYSSTGSYTVKLVRSFTCFTDTAVKVINVTSPSLSVISPSMACGVNSATAIVIGGTGPYTYSWSPSSQTTAVASITNSGGIYTVSVNDGGGGCSITGTTYIANTILNGTVNNSHLLCFGVGSATAGLTVSGGSGNYTYTWTGTSQTSSAVTGLLPGTQTVIIYDASNQCVLTKTFIVNQPQPLTLNMTSTHTGTCVNNSLLLWSNTGGGTAPYQYTWTNGPAAPVFTVSQSLPGTYVYTLHATDANNCAGSNTIAVSFGPYPVLSAPSLSLCFGKTVNLQASGAISYTWQPGSHQGSVYPISPSSSQVYTVTGDSLGCAITTTAMATVLSNPTLFLGSNSPLCVGQTLILNLSSNAIQYSWQGPNGYSSSALSPSINTAATINTGTYSVTVTGSNSCSSGGQVPVTVHANPTISISGNTFVCIPQSVTLTVSGAGNYNWSTGATGSVIVVNPSSNSTYTVTGYQWPPNCSDTKTVSVKVSECVGIEEADELKQTRLYPNPTSGDITIEAGEQAELKLFNQVGQLLLTQKIMPGNNNLNLSLFVDGVYYLSMDSGAEKKIQKIVKIR